MVAKHWTAGGEFETGHCAEMVVIEETVDEVAGVDLAELNRGEDGGHIRVLNAPEGVLKVKEFEYLMGKFGGPRPSTPRNLVWAEPADACSPLTNLEAVEKSFVL